MKNQWFLLQRYGPAGLAQRPAAVQGVADGGEDHRAVAREEPGAARLAADGPVHVLEQRNAPATGAGGDVVRVAVDEPDLF